VGGHQAVLVAGQDPLTISSERLRSWCEQDPRFERACQTFGGDLRPYVRDRVLETAGIDRFIKDIAERAAMTVEEMVATDDSLYLEYATPRGNVLPGDSGTQMRKRLGTYAR
jgi:spermidine synthase